MKDVPGVKAEVQGVCAPSQLPGAKVGLPALLVQVSKNEEQQQGHNTGQQQHVDGKGIHGAQDCFNRSFTTVNWENE
jgi:hypothetical protein